MAMLPMADTRELSRVVCRDEAALRPGVEQLCRVLGVNTVGLSRFAERQPVYTVGDLVLKLFPPVFLENWRVEAEVLAAVEERLPARRHGCAPRASMTAGGMS